MPNHANSTGQARQPLHPLFSLTYSARMRGTTLLMLVLACAPPAPSGLRAADEGSGPQVNFDVFHAPLPEIPLPNDFASRFDDLSPTKRRINASVAIAKTKWEQHTRAGLDTASGWGTLAPITVSFSAPLDLENIVARHQAPADVADDALYVVDVTRNSPEFCKPTLVDLGQGHFPLVGDEPEYFEDEPHASMQSLFFDQEEEDLNHNGLLDPGEDTDMDGVLDHPNTRDGHTGPFDVIGFYEKETNTLIARPLMPMRQATTYAVVLTKRLVGRDGQPVRSPFSSINHLGQTQALTPLNDCLAPLGLSLDDVAFTWSFTTQSLSGDYQALRDGLYGQGSLAFLGSTYPAEFSQIDDVRRSSKESRNTKIVSGDQFAQFGGKLFEVYGGDQSSGTKDALAKWLTYVDFYASASFISPQFFPRVDGAGAPLPLYDQIFNISPAQGQAYHRPERVPAFLAVPKNRKGPAPVVIFMHGHGQSLLDSLLVMGPFARSGIATIGIDAVSHGIGLAADDRQVVTDIIKPYGFEQLVNAVVSDGRALDQDGDGIVDSGADFFTAYVVHTRDVVRQTVIDNMQLIRVLRSFDGQRRWAFDVNRDGEPDLAGDFDGDGVVDLGGPNVPIYVAGVSLGGIMTSLVGGVEPEVDAIAPILPGGYLSEIGGRSTLGRVRIALVLRMMGPLLVGQPNAAGQTDLFEIVPDLTSRAKVKVAQLPSLKPGWLAVATNLKTHEFRCGRVQPNGHLRLAVPSDEGDALRVEVFDRELPSKPLEGCDPEGVAPIASVDSLGYDAQYQTHTYAKGSPLIAFTDGYGLRRGSPELRRLLSLAQVALEPADPANFAPNWEGRRTLTYGDGSTVSTRALLMPMTGDPGVPIATAIALGRAAGLIDFENVDPRYGKTPQQQLIDLGIVEGVERTHRYQAANGKDALMDADVFEDVTHGDDGFGAPRLRPPLRLVRDGAQGGKVGFLLPYMDPRGDHSLPIPDGTKAFDLGTLLFNLFTDYVGSGGSRVSFDACMERSTCSWFTP